MLEVKVERCAGIDVAKKFVMVCVSTIRHYRCGIRRAEGVVVGERLHRSGNGENGFILETGVQHFGRKSESDIGQPIAS
jgi:hypothetical protein